MADTPQTNKRYVTIPFDPGERVAVADTNEFGLLAVPNGVGARLAITNIDVFCEVLHVPDTGSTTVDIEFQDMMLDGIALQDVARRFNLTNVTEDRVFDANSAVEQEVANVFGTFIADVVQGPPYPAYTITNQNVDRVWDADSTSDAELADILTALILDVTAGEAANGVPRGGFFNVSNLTTDRESDISGPPANAEFADLLGTFANDIQPRSNLRSAFDLGTISIREMVNVWSGRQLLNPGDTINAELATHTNTTVGHGYSFILEYEVLKHS